MNLNSVSLDHRIIYRIIEQGSRVLDLGCGNGELMYLLAKDKDAKVQGIEIDEEAIYKCVAKGLSVFHGDIDSGLKEYPDDSFDYVILNQAMQQAKKADFVILEALRVGKKLIIGFPNFGFINARASIFFRGQTPVTPSLPYRWYNTPNLHFLTISDFRSYCTERKIRILESHFLSGGKPVSIWPNLLATDAIFVMTK